MDQIQQAIACASSLKIAESYLQKLRARQAWDLDEPLLMATLVHLAHAAKFLKNAGHGVELKLTASDPPIDDVLNNARNISVHMLSGGAKADDYDNYVRVAAVEGKGIGMQWADGTNLENEYDDDVAFFYGAHRIYLVRHLERFTATARQKANTYFREQLRAAGHPAPPDNHFL